MIAETPTQTAQNKFRPGRLWSLWDMMRFFASSWMAAISGLGRVSTFIQTMAMDRDPPDLVADQDIIRKELEKVEGVLGGLPLSAVVQAQYERVRRLVDHSSSQQLVTMVQELHNNLIVEMGSHWFLVINSTKREYFEQKSLPFGEEVAKSFGDANRDIAAASRCFALDEWTACVFHLMRALEHALRYIAEDVGLTCEQIANENWKNVIDLIEAKIRAMEGQKKTQEKIDRLKVLSAAAVQFRYFKDAWRNHVSHAHETYDEREAETVYTHVKTFMEQVAHTSLQKGQPV